EIVSHQAELQVGLVGPPAAGGRLLVQIEATLELLDDVLGVGPPVVEPPDALGGMVWRECWSVM
ncbi:hypothetical protein MYX64_12435, partial [Nitrospinae bacterium AH_259_B05_G02_I21]|nr:hypothetical protein [Nitrospinae bacterium AH_259_B05_G02_I21]